MQLGQGGLNEWTVDKAGTGTWCWRSGHTMRRNERAASRAAHGRHNNAFKPLPSRRHCLAQDEH